MKYNNESVNQLTVMEISKLENRDTIQRLELQLKRAEKEISVYKSKEKQAARAIVLYERKLDYLRNNLVETLGMIADDLKNNFDTINKVVFQNIEKINKLIEFVQSETKLTIQDKSFVTNVNTTIDDRFAKLKMQFEERIGSSVMRGPGRPNKERQSIIADIGIGGNKSKIKNEKKKNQEKIDRIFFSKSSGAKAKSNVPQTDDSIFDFDEALNPELSLSDIMKDIESERNDLKEKKQMTKEQMLEAGYITKPKIKK